MYLNFTNLFFQDFFLKGRYPYFCGGEMAERSNAAVLKTVDCNRSGGSNPSLSAEPHNKLKINKLWGFFYAKNVFFEHPDLKRNQIGTFKCTEEQTSYLYWNIKLIYDHHSFSSPHIQILSINTSWSSLLFGNEYCYDSSFHKK